MQILHPPAVAQGVSGGHVIGACGGGGGGCGDLQQIESCEL